MACNHPGEPIETRLSDRAILLHALQHLEELAPLAEHLPALAELAGALPKLRPLLAMLPGNGAPADAITAGQALRTARRLGRHRGVGVGNG